MQSVKGSAKTLESLSVMQDISGVCLLGWLCLSGPFGPSHWLAAGGSHGVCTSVGVDFRFISWVLSHPPFGDKGLDSQSYDFFQ